MATLSDASHQWFTRPDPERYTSLLTMQDEAQQMRARSRGQVRANRLLSAAPVHGDNFGLCVVDRDNGPMVPSNWAFGQFARLAGAPAGYLQSLPAAVAADCLNWGLHKRDIEEIGVLSRDDFGPGSPSTMLAATGPNYGRIWNSQIIDALVKRFGDGVTGDWRVPGEFGVAVDVNKANTTLYMSDRDMFVFLADETNRIEVKGRRQLANGTAINGSLARGFFMWNSDVGSSSYGIAAFLFDYACKNRTVWGAEQLGEIRLRHTAGAPVRFIDEIAPALEKYAHSDTGSIVHAIESARQARIDDVDAFLAERFTGGQAKGIVLAHAADEGRPIETLYDMSNAITAYAREIKHQDERVALERIGGKVLALAA